MGGSLAVAIRKSNGEEYIATRHTNSIPQYLTNPDFYLGDEVIEEYIAAGKNSPYFSQLKTIRPDEYGILIIDKINKWIYSCQNYCNPNHFNLVFVEREDAINLIKLMDKGWVKEFDYYDFKSPRRILYQDEILILRSSLEKLAAQPPNNNVFVEAFDCPLQGSFTAKKEIPGWLIYHSMSALKSTWNDLSKFLKDSGWKTKTISKTKVKDNY